MPPPPAPYTPARQYVSPQQQPSYHPAQHNLPQPTLPVGSDFSVYLPTKKALEGLDSARVAGRRIKAGSNDFLDAVEERRAEVEKRRAQFLYDQAKKG